MNDAKQKKVLITTIAFLLIVVPMVTVPISDAVTWSSDVRLTTYAPYDDMIPSVMQTNDGSIWVVWASGRTSNKEIFYKTSSDNGLSWSSIVQLTNNAVNDTTPSITQNIDNTIWVVWVKEISALQYDLYYKTSTDYGVSWSDEKHLPTNSWDLQPSITQTGNGTLWVVWSSYRVDDNYELFIMNSTDYGVSWSDATRLTTDVTLEDLSPSIIQDVEGTIWVVWSKEEEIYFKTSTNLGQTWSSDTLLEKSPGDDMDPSVVNTQDRKIWVVWESTRTGDCEIWYKTSTEIPSVHDIAATNMSAWRDHGDPATWVTRGKSVYINVTVENHGTYMETFNVTAYADRNTGDVHVEIDTEYNVVLTAGANTTVSLTWNTSSTPYGTYYLSAEATPVQGEYDTVDNVLVHGAKIGGIGVLWHPREINVLGLLAPLALAMLVIAAVGTVAVGFFKLLMSIRLRCPWHRSLRSCKRRSKGKYGPTFNLKAYSGLFRVRSHVGIDNFKGMRSNEKA